jgi:two-component system, NarL family, nitrate/nitrite response regulator NarL
MKLLLADDHHLVREALSHYLRQAAGDVTVIEASTFDEALNKANANDALDAVILDLRMPGMNGLGGLDAMRAKLPNTPVVIMSGNISRDEASAAMERGAAGIIPKDLRGAALINALRLVLAGETYVPASLFGRGGEGDGGRSTEEASRQALGNLTRRELEVVKLLSGGLSNKEIANRLNLAENTIKMHLQNAFRKMGARSRADAVRIALSKNISDLG